MCKYGSHNSMSYLPTTKWWMRLGRFIYRCQTKTIKEQAEDMDYIDIRLAVIDGEVNFAHGLAVFKGGIDDLLEVLDTYEGYVRVLWEDNYDKSEDAEEIFIDICENLKTTYPDVKFVGGRQKSTWRVIYNFGTPDPAISDMYSSMDEEHKWCCWCPCLYAAIYNNSNIEDFEDLNCDDIIMLYDFVK